MGFLPGRHSLRLTILITLVLGLASVPAATAHAMRRIQSRAFTRASLEAMFFALDTDHDGYISRDDLRRWADTNGTVLTDEEIDNFVSIGEKNTRAMLAASRASGATEGIGRGRPGTKRTTTEPQKRSRSSLACPPTVSSVSWEAARRPGDQRQPGSPKQAPRRS